MSRKGRSNIFIFFIVVVMIGVAAYFFRSQQGQEVGNNKNATPVNEEIPAVGGPDEGEDDGEAAQNKNADGAEEGSVDSGGEYQVYSNEEAGVSLQHNSSVTQETKQEGGVTVYFDANTVSVLPADSLPVVESAFSGVKESGVTVAGYPARRI